MGPGGSWGSIGGLLDRAIVATVAFNVVVLPTGVSGETIVVSI